MHDFFAVEIELIGKSVYVPKLKEGYTQNDLSRVQAGMFRELFKDRIEL
ncbi:MAG: hypothetical protein ACKVJF_07445 [Flavobacteriales bacterium]